MTFGAHYGFYIRNYFYFLNNNYKIMDGLSQIVATAANKVQKFTSTFFQITLHWVKVAICNCFFVCLLYAAHEVVL